MCDPVMFLLYFSRLRGVVHGVVALLALHEAFPAAGLAALGVYAIIYPLNANPVC